MYKKIIKKKNYYTFIKTLKKKKINFTYVIKNLKRNQNGVRLQTSQLKIRDALTRMLKNEISVFTCVKICNFNRILLLHLLMYAFCDPVK